MFGWLKKKKIEPEIYHVEDTVPEEINSFIANVHSALEVYTSVEIMTIGDSFCHDGNIQIWYSFHTPSGKIDTYPILDYQKKVLSKVQINKYTKFKIMYAGFDSDGDFISFEKKFSGEKALRALSFFCYEVDKQRKHEQLLEAEAETGVPQ